MSPPKSIRRRVKDADSKPPRLALSSEKSPRDFKPPAFSLDLLHISSDNNTFSGTKSVALYALVPAARGVGSDDCVCTTIR